MRGSQRNESHVRFLPSGRTWGALSAILLVLAVVSLNTVSAAPDQSNGAGRKLKSTPTPTPTTAPGYGVTATPAPGATFTATPTWAPTSTATAAATPTPSPTSTATPTVQPSPTLPAATSTPVPAPGSLTVSSVTPNSATIPLYEKLELTFDISGTVATNLQFPYDPTTPAGLQAGVGISVDGLFLPPGQTDWQSAIIQPGFLYQDYQRQQISGSEWLYPQGRPVWKVRFAPKLQGTWQYRVRAQDGATYPNWVQTQAGSFTVGAASTGNHGFVEQSKTDPRYFAMSDGSRFVGVGHDAPTLETAGNYGAASQLQTYQANGIDLVRVWMSQSGIAGSAWNPWAWWEGPWYGGYIPNSNLQNPPNTPPLPGHDFALQLDTVAACVFNGWQSNNNIAVKPNTAYRLAVTAMVSGVTGPRDATNPNYGFTVKEGQWPSTCPDGLSSYPNLLPYQTNTGWTTLQTTYQTGPTQSFIENLFLMLDNATGGGAVVTEVSLREVLSGGGLGPELVGKGKSDMHLSFDQKASWGWDYLFDQAAQAGVRLKTVVLEKNDRVWDRINPDGSMTTSDENNRNFYNPDRTKVRRLQEYFWRYLAGRWGYSTAVHSWELMNEGDPYNSDHYNMTNDFAGFIHEWDRNHLASTSNWTSYPASEFWGNPSYPNVDYADIHAYTDTSPITLDPHDDAAFHLALSQWVRSQGVPKPTIRGETGIGGINGEDPGLAKDTRGVWLHNFTWSQMDPGAMYDLYWYTDNIVNNNLYFQYKPYRDFMQGIPLDNGRYRDAQATASATSVRVVGQKDIAAGRAHLWVQNSAHTWWNVVNGASWGRLSGTVTIPGFAPGQAYPLDWWQFDGPGNLTRSQSTATADAAGNIVLNLSALPSTVTDVAVKVGN